MYFRHEVGADYAYRVSLSDYILMYPDDIEPCSISLMSALEVTWKNADRRSTFTITPLDEYVWREDNTYAWRTEDELFREDEHTKTYVLNVTSQTWLDDSVMDRPIWWHYAVVVVPKVTRIPDAAMALIVGWNNKDSNDPASVLSRSDTKRLTNYVASSGIVGVAVYQTPNQPITFVDEPLPNIYRNGRSEDGIIARTWKMFSENTGNPDVLLRLPMTKRKLSHHSIQGNSIYNFRRFFFKFAHQRGHLFSPFNIERVEHLEVCNNTVRK
jgi:hypothetical protein